MPAATFSSANFALQGGATLPVLDVAYETYGDPANTSDSTLLLLHGYTSSAHAGGGGEETPGWWEFLIGPGRAIDTNRYFVVAPNMLGSSYGSTGPASLDPGTGKPYGPSFPNITTRDMIETHRRLLDHLGAGELAAVVGYSYGGYLTFEWGVTYPNRMRALVPVATGATGRGDDSTVRELEAHFEQAPGWDSGNFYGNGAGVRERLIDFRTNVLRNYGVDQELRDRGLGEKDIETELRGQAEAWARDFDPNSLITLRRCAVRYDAKPSLTKITAPLLYVLATTDALFGPELGAPTVAHINEVSGASAEYFELDSSYGHRAPSVDWAKWGDALRDFLNRHAALENNRWDLRNE